MSAARPPTTTATTAIGAQQEARGNIANGKLRDQQRQGALNEASMSLRHKRQGAHQEASNNILFVNVKVTALQQCRALIKRPVTTDMVLLSRCPTTGSTSPRYNNNSKDNNGRSSRGQRQHHHLQHEAPRPTTARRFQQGLQK